MSYNLTNNINNIPITKQRDGKKRPVSGAICTVGGGYFGSKAIFSGLRQSLGIQLETHITTKENAKKIISAGCILEPKFGGTGFSAGDDYFISHSKNYVHITGINNKSNTMVNKVFNDLYDYFSQKHNLKKLPRDFDIQKSFLFHPFRILYKKRQENLYKNIALNNIPSNKKIKRKIFATLGVNSKKFYVAGTYKYFNENFIPDTEDIALKTSMPLKVFKTKIGAVFGALKRDGVSGIKQNKSRAVFGAGITLSCAFTTYKLIKGGLNKLGIIKKEEKVDTNK